MPLRPETSRTVPSESFVEELQEVHCPRCGITWRSPNSSASLYAHTAWAHSIELEGHAHV